MDDQLTVLVESVRQLGQELVKTDAIEPALRVARDRMVELSRELSEYLYNLTWDRAWEKAWAEAGMQSEEDAEYG